MHNVFVSAVRRTKTTESLEAADGAVPDSTTTGMSAETDAAVSDIRRALMRLPDDQREAILRVGLEQRSYAQAKFAIEAPIGTVMSRRSRGRERLRPLLDGSGAQESHTVAPSTLRRVK